MQHFISTYGYLAVFLLTVLEAGCIPIPSELTLGLAGALASGAVDPQPQAQSGRRHRHRGGRGAGWARSSPTRWAAPGAGAFVDRFGKYLLLTHKDLDRAEAWFARRGPSAVLVGRVVPVVRTFISFPAGVAEMPVLAFGVFTAIGVTVWVGVLAGIGYALGGSYHSMVKAFGDATYVVAALVVLALALTIWHRYRAMRAERQASPSS